MTDNYVYLQQDPTALLGLTLIAGGLSPGHEESVQYSYFPWTITPEESTSVAHQGESPSMVVHVVCFRRPNVNGKTQFPQDPVPDPDPEAEVDGAGVVVVVVGGGVEELVFEADSHGTAAASSVAEGGLQVLMFVNWESSQSLKYETSA